LHKNIKRSLGRIVVSNRECGIIVSGSSVTVFDAEVPDTGALTGVGNHLWNLQNGDRGDALWAMHRRVHSYLSENKITSVVMQATAAGGRPIGKAHLESAELRGVVHCAAASIVPVIVLARNAISKNFGERKVDEYVKDDEFWETNIDGELMKRSRAAALLLLHKRSK
jgi:hypothetical protein